MYLYQADAFCDDCGAAIADELPTPEGFPNESAWDSNEYPKGPYTEGQESADCPQHCAHCEALLDTGLTDYGVAYVADALVAWDGRPEILEQWAELYANYGSLPWNLEEMDDSVRAALRAYADHTGDNSYALEHFDEAYRGAWDSVEDYALELVDSLGLGLFPDPSGLAARYFDSEAFARDLELGGDIFTEKIPYSYGRVWVFNAHV